MKICIVDTETTIDNTVADFGAVVADRPNGAPSEHYDPAPTVPDQGRLPTPNSIRDSMRSRSVTVCSNTPQICAATAATNA